MISLCSGSRTEEFLGDAGRSPCRPDRRAPRTRRKSEDGDLVVMGVERGEAVGFPGGLRLLLPLADVTLQRLLPRGSLSKKYGDRTKQGRPGEEDEFSRDDAQRLCGLRRDEEDATPRSMEMGWTGGEALSDQRRRDGYDGGVLPGGKNGQGLACAGLLFWDSTS